MVFGASPALLLCLPDGAHYRCIHQGMAFLSYCMGKIGCYPHLASCPDETLSPLKHTTPK